MVKGYLTRALVAGGIVLGAASLAFMPSPAAARVSVGIGVGIPLVAPVYPAPVYAAPPAYYYGPPPPYAAPPPPPPPYAAPPAAVPAPTAAANSECREYTTTETIAGTPQQVHGTACRQPDGSWRIMD